MVPDGATKRKRGDIRVQLAVSAFVLLAPPLVMASGVMYLGLQGDGQQAAGPQAAVAGDKPAAVAERPDIQPDGAANFALASAAQHPVIAEPRPVAAAVVTAQPAAMAQRPAAAGGQAASTKDSARYHGAVPATLVHAGPASDQSATAEVEAPPSAAKAADSSAADAPAAVPEQSPAATQTHNSGRKARHEARKPQRAPSLADIFLRPAARPRATPRG
jgi:hypothetical protein